MAALKEFRGCPQISQISAKKKRISTSRDIHLTEKKTKSEWQWSPDSIHAHLRRLERSGVWIIRDALEDDAGVAVFMAIDCRQLGNTPVHQ